MKLFLLLIGHDLYVLQTHVYVVFIINHVQNISIYQQYVFTFSAEKGRFYLLECI